MPVLGTRYQEHLVWQGRKTTGVCVLKEAKVWSCRSRREWAVIQSNCSHFRHHDVLLNDLPPTHHYALGYLFSLISDPSVTWSILFLQSLPQSSGPSVSLLHDAFPDAPRHRPFSYPSCFLHTYSQLYGALVIQHTVLCLPDQIRYFCGQHQGQGYWSSSHPGTQQHTPSEAVSLTGEEVAPTGQSPAENHCHY